MLKDRDDADRRSAFIILLSGSGYEPSWGTSSMYPVHTFGFMNHYCDNIAEETKGKHFAEYIAGDGDLEKFAAGFETMFSAVGARASLACVHPGVLI